MERDSNEDRHSFNIDVNKLTKVMSEIFSDMYGCKITITAIKKDEAK